MHHLISVKLVVMTIFHIAEKEVGGLDTVYRKTLLGLQHAFGLHAAQSRSTCDTNP